MSNLFILLSVSNIFSQDEVISMRDRLENEEEVFRIFFVKYSKEKSFNEFFEDWDKDEWHKHKKTCKRFVSDDALEIISADINWLIKGFGDEIWQDYKKEHEPYIPERYKDLLK